MEEVIKKKRNFRIKRPQGEKKQMIIDMYGKYSAPVIAEKVGCCREYVYIVWKNCGMKVGRYKTPIRKEKEDDRNNYGASFGMGY